MSSLCPGVAPKAHSLVEPVGAKKSVVVVQEIEPKVCFSFLWGLYTFMEVTVKLLLNPEPS